MDRSSRTDRPAVGPADPRAAAPTSPSATSTSGTAPLAALHRSEPSLGPELRASAMLLVLAVAVTLGFAVCAPVVLRLLDALL